MTNPRTNELGELYCVTCERQFVGSDLCPNDGTRLIRLTAAADPLLGRELDGRFTILEKLGQGGMGAVYRARQHSMGREVAVKVLSAALVSDALSIKRFLREAKLASRLAHPNVVAVLDFGQTRDGVFYLVMELVEGQTLQAVLERKGRLELPRMLRIATQICDALESAHALPIMHRDLKPANVMVLPHGRDLVKVLDFGLAKSLSTDDTGGTMTGTGALLGTPAFMPPEIANGVAADHRADLYSLGCIMYAMGTGCPPFVTDSILEMISMHGSHPAPRMADMPEEIAAVVDRLLQKDPDWRYQSAAELRVALEEAYELTRTSRPVASPAGLTTPASGTSLATPRRREATLPDYHETMATLAASSDAIAPPKAASNRRARRRWLWLVAIVLGAMAAAAVVLVSSSSLPDPDRPEGGAIVEPPPQQHPPTQPAPPMPPPMLPPMAPPTVDHKIVPPTEPPITHTVPDPITKRPAKRPPGHKQPGTTLKTEPPTEPPTPPTLPTPPTPPPEPRHTGSGSAVRPGAGSNAPF